MMRNFKNRVYVHRDIKSDNLLLHKTLNGKVFFKLADFGFSKSISEENAMMTSILGTPLYMSPQIHLKEGYTAKADIFSFGVLFF